MGNFGQHVQDGAKVKMVYIARSDANCCGLKLQNTTDQKLLLNYTNRLSIQSKILII